MPATSIQPAFPIFTDIDGQPLEAGLIWLGTAGNNPISSPITAYWDAALTQVVTQPVTTRGGYPLNGSAVGRLYVNADYSILVRNRVGSDVVSALNATERYDSSLITFIQAGAGAVSRTVQAKLRDTVSVKDFGAVGNGVADDTVAVQAAVNAATPSGTIYFPAGVYRITSTININGLVRNVSLIGDTGFLGVVPGGASVNSASILMWDGAAGGLMFLCDSTMGTEFQRLMFRTKSPSLDVITISGVYGIRFINKASCRYNVIRDCQFSGLYAGIHFYDDGSNASSNTNMDGQLIEQCYFSDNQISVLIDQTNVYDTDFYRCSFYGNTAYTKHHVWVKKGHAYLRACYLGVLKNAASTGGKDGIAVYVQSGFMQFSDCYGEAHNGPFFVWDVAEPSSVCSGFSNCIILTDESSLPTTYNLLNKTSSRVVIMGGRITGTVSQFAGTTGAICAFNSHPITADSTSEPDKVSYFGADKNTYPGIFGTVPNGTSNGGKATLEGYTCQLDMVNDTDGRTFRTSYASDVVSFNSPGYKNGPKFDYANGVVQLADTGWLMEVDGTATSCLKYRNGTANGSVATTLGSVGPTGANAGNPLGWLTIKVGSATRYIPFW